MAEPILVDAAGAAELLAMSERLVRDLTIEGRIPSVDIGDHRNRLYSVEALRRWALEASDYTRDEGGSEHGTTISTKPGRTLGPGRPRTGRPPAVRLRPLEGGGARKAR